MNTNSLTEETITSLIEKYNEGMTSTEEERQLIEYFSQSTVSPSLRSHQSFFRALGNLQHNPLMMPVDSIEIPAESKHKSLQIIRWASAAAIALIVIISSLVYNNKNQDYVMIDGEKYTDMQTIENALHASLDNVKIDSDDILSELEGLSIE